jgi:hypothetical protein
MTIETQAIDLEKVLAPSLAKFLALGARVCSEDGLAKTHSEVENMLWTDGLETLRQLFQDHFDLRSEREEPQDSVTGSDGVERTHHRASGRDLETKFGTVRAGRIAYAARGSQSLHPLDAELNLPDDLFSFGVRRRAAEEVAKGSHEAAVEALKSTTGASVGKRQVEELAVRAAMDFEAFYSARAETMPVTDTRGGILVLSTDAKGIVVHKEDLREETRKAAEKTCRKLEKRLAKGEKRNRKRMAQVVAVYTIGRFRRSPSDVMDELRRVKKMKKRPKPHSKRVWASVIANPEKVIRAAFIEALSRDPDRTKTWVAPVDGNASQIKILTDLAQEFGVKLVIVLDVIHVIEYVWRAAYAFYADGSPEAQQWVSDRIWRILEGGASNVAAGMRRSATLRGLTGKKRKAVDACADYLLNHSEFLRYHEYLADGLPIASGVIEGACRHLIADRMDLTGARWRLQGAEAVLRLRALHSSGDFDEYWRFHEAQEAKRNHAALFALPLTPHADQTPAAKAS